MATSALLDPARQAPVGDSNEKILGVNLADRVDWVKDRLQAEGLTAARLCLPMDVGLGAIAVLIATWKPAHGPY
jgi:hypothetical protein